MKYVMFAILAVAFLVAPAAHAQKASTPTMPTVGIKITFLMYSGRPNPEMIISRLPDVAQIVSTLRARSRSQAAVTRTASAPRLGYTGIRIELLRRDTQWSQVKDEWQELVDSWRDVKIFNGEIELTPKTSGSRGVYVEDSHLKQLLLAHARNNKVLDAREMEIVGQ